MGRKRTTTKEGPDGRLHVIRDDGRARLMSRDRALRWATRNAPTAVARLRRAYDAAETRAKVGRLLPRAKELLEEFGWTAVDGDYASPAVVEYERVVGGRTNRTIAWTVAAVLLALGPEVAREKFEDVDGGLAFADETDR